MKYIYFKYTLNILEVYFQSIFEVYFKYILKAYFKYTPTDVLQVYISPLYFKYQPVEIQKKKYTSSLCYFNKRSTFEAHFVKLNRYFNINVKYFKYTLSILKVYFLEVYFKYTLSILPSTVLQKYTSSILYKKIMVPF